MQIYYYKKIILELSLCFCMAAVFLNGVINFLAVK